MTQSLLNDGLTGNNHTDKLRANPKWVSGEEFRARPVNASGADRVEQVRKKDTKEQFLAIRNKDTGMFKRKGTSLEYTPGSLEVRIIEIE